jgi:hypothetical protein
MKSIRLDNQSNIIITTDNAGSVGEKVLDSVKTSYDILAYHTLKNAVMENLSYKTKIIGITMSNFCGDNEYLKLQTGVSNLIKELGYDVEVLTSSESNFIMTESAFGVTVIGLQQPHQEERYTNYAVIGKPLVGSDVIDQSEYVATFSDFLYLLNHDNVSSIKTVGSKGIQDRGKEDFNITFDSSDINVFKSAGPSTCLLIEYNYLENIKESIIKKLFLLSASTSSN